MPPPRIPCPNPICPHDFTAAEYSAAISCPRCGTDLPALAAAPADDVPTAIPFATPASSPDLPKGNPSQDAPTVPLAAVVPAPPPAAPPFPVGEPALVRPKVAPRRGAPFGVVVPILVSGLFVAFLAAGLLILFNRHALFREAGGDAIVLKELNCSFRKPNPQVWQSNDALRRALDGELAFERADPPVWGVLAAKDYKVRAPRSDELYAEAARRIKAAVPNAAIEEPGDAPPVAGQAVRRLVFQGEVDETSVSGECSMFAHQGVGYWLVIWTPAAEVGRAHPEFTMLRGSLALLDGRAGWKESGGGTPFVAADQSVSLRDVDGWWEANDPPTAFAPEAVLALRLSPKKMRAAPKDPTAEVVVFKLAKAGPPAEAARQFAREWLRKGAYKQAELEEWTDRSPGESPPVPAGGVGVFGPPQRLRVKKTPELSDFALLAAAERGEHVFVVWCACQRPRDWEPAFRILLETVRFADGG